MISASTAQYNIGIDRFLELVDSDFFKESAFFRFMPRVFAQFGIATDPAVTKKWAAAGPIADEGHSTPAQREHLRRGDVSFTGHGKNSRLTELFIVTGESEHLGIQNWESPVAHVPLDDMTSVIDKLYSEYGNFAPFGKGPDHGLCFKEFIYLTFRLCFTDSLMFFHRTITRGGRCVSVEGVPSAGPHSRLQAPDRNPQSALALIKGMTFIHLQDILVFVSNFLFLVDGSFAERAWASIESPAGLYARRRHSRSHRIVAHANDRTCAGDSCDGSVCDSLVCAAPQRPSTLAV
jgi:cyclophilin family peptidyl-prolyl cis-trans isomerase